MPVVLTDDLNDFKTSQVKDRLGDPFASTLDAPTGSDSLTNPQQVAPPDLAPAPAPAPLPPTPTAPLVPPPSIQSESQPTGNYDAALDWGHQQIGKGYIWGSAGGRSDLSGNAPGYDCSGFVSQFYKQMGKSVPAQTSAAYAATTHLDETDAKPGDIVEFNMNSNDPHEQHIAIYLGNGQVLQSGGTRHDVNIGRVDQFGAGTYEFRRASGGTDSTASKATSAVAKTATSDPVAQSAAVKDKLGDPFAAIGDAANAVGQAKDDALAQAQKFKDTLGNPFDALPSGHDVGTTVGGAIGGALGGMVGPAGADAGQQLGSNAGGALMDEQRRLQHTPVNTDDPAWAIATMGGEAEGAGKIAGKLAGEGTASTEVMQGMLNMLRKAGGHDPAELDALQSQIDSLGGTSALDRAQAAVDAIAAKNPLMSQGSLDASGAGKELARLKAETPATPTAALPEDVPHGTLDETPVTPRADPPPPETWDAQGNQVTGSVDSEPSISYQDASARGVESGRNGRTLGPDGKLAPGEHKIPGEPGGAVDPADLPRPENKIISDTQPEPDSSGPVTTEPFGHGPVSRAGITPETVQMAHERIDTALGHDPAKVDLAHNELDQMLSAGASPSEVARFLTTDVEGSKVALTDKLRSLRTGSLAGGLSTEVKVGLGPIVQVAMRAPVAALKAIVKGKPGDIGNGLHGGLEGLADGAHDALQTMKYGINYRSALTGGAQGGYGFKPGLDVLGQSKLSRAAGTAMLGLVRTHGAAADISAGIGRGAAKATGASDSAAAEVGQQWALRSGKYGTVGQAVANAFEGIRQTNPALNVMGQILLPFYRVGYNALTQGIERSPVGLVGTGIDIARSKLPASVDKSIRGPYAAGADASHVTPVGDRLANNMFGVGLATIGFAEAGQGNITGEHPQNGDPKWSVKVAGQWVPLRILGPAGEALTQSAVLYEAARDGKGDVAREAALSAAGYVTHIADDTWIRGIGDIFNAIGDARDIGTSRETQAKNNIGYTVGSEAKSFLPESALITQVGKAASDAPSSGVSSGASSRPSRPSRPTRPSR